MLILKKFREYDWVKKTIKVFSQGLTARELALSITLGVVVGVIPLLGVATPLLAGLAIILRLNLGVTMFVTYAVTPLHILLFIPFIRIGEFIFNAGHTFNSFAELKHAFQNEGLSLFSDLAMQLGFGITGWTLVALPASIILFPVLWKVISYFRKT